MVRRIGIDVGSKTIKVVVLDDGGRIVRSAYRRHRSTIRVSLATALRDMVDCEGDEAGSVAFTGSAGIAASALVGAPFVQEVVAATGALRAFYPQADAALELGGEDAKVIYLSGGLEQRMNASCAGGTGGFVDTIAFSLGVRASDMNRLAQQATRRYPIASRCAVFAQTDVRPLLNAGADRADIAASALDAVVRQTIGGLACGRPLRGTVVLLGGPIAHIPYLADRFRAALGLDEAHGIVPDDAHLLVAAGAALAGEGATSLSELAARFAAADLPDDGFERLPALFEGAVARRAFERRHAAHRYPRRPLSQCDGALYAGFDAGSTAVKLAVVDAQGSLAYSDCRPVRGDAAGTAAVMLKAFYRELDDAGRRRAVAPQRDRVADARPAPPYLARVVATGYGERILIAGLGVDAGVVETAAHARCVAFTVPDATFLLDIGGQDIKALWMSDGVVVDAVLNEACSSGCGAFLEGTAYAAGSTPAAFSQAALRAENPIDLGTRCTVFMTSRVRHAQKSGARISDIAAGASYSVVRNALDRVVGRTRAESMGSRIVVQGGTFASDAVLRAFELLVGREAVRLDVAQLSGAIGAALIARDECADAADARSGIADMAELAYFSPKREHVRCEGCGNACELVVVLFGTGRAAVEGARCERGALDAAQRFGVRVATFGDGSSERPPNAIAAEQERLARYSDEPGRGPRAGTVVGLVGAIDGFSTLPFWHALVHELGFSIVVPTAARVAACADDALETVGAEGVCWPAKRSHARLLAAVRAGASAVLAPRLSRGRRCAVRASYADALAAGFGFAASEGEDDGASVRRCETGAAADVRMASPLLSSARPERICENAEDRAAISRALSALCPETPIDGAELDRAFDRARAAWEAFREVGAREAREALAWVASSPDRIGLVFASRPYLVDADVLHGIDEAAREHGFAVIGGVGLDALAEERKDARAGECDAAWPCAQRLVDRVRFAASHPRLEVACVRAFGCGYDAEAVEEARAAAAASGRAVMSFTVDEIADLAHIGIRMRTLAFFARQRAGGTSRAVAPAGLPANMCFTAELLARRLTADARACHEERRFGVPRVCERCQLDAVSAIASRATGRPIEVAWADPAAAFAGAALARASDAVPTRPRIGIVGSALLCFDEAANGGVVRLVESLGCEAVLPSPADASGDDVRYLRQLDRLYADGVRDVVYLQSFGCLKANVAVRGGARELARRYPGLRLTIVDFDAEASALNRENRIRLAVEAAKTRDNGFDRPGMPPGPEDGR